MKKLILVFTCIVFTAPLVFGQRLKMRDPGYSSANYKHPNKAAFARLHNLDNSVTLTSSVAKRNDNYKHPNSSTLVVAAVIPVAINDNSRKSYKHPMGL